MAEAIEQKKPKEVVFSGGGSFGTVFDGNVRQYGWLPAIFMQVFNWLFGKLEHLEQLTEEQNTQLKNEASKQLERSAGEYNRAVAQNLAPATNWSMANLHALGINSLSGRAFETLYDKMQKLHEDNKLGYVNQLMKMSEVDRKYVIPIIENNMLLSNIDAKDKEAILKHLKDPKNNSLDMRQESILMSCRKSGAIVALINIGEINHMVETADNPKKPFYTSNPDKPTEDNPDPTGSAVSKMQMRASTFTDFMSRLLDGNERGKLADIGKTFLRENNISADKDQVLTALVTYIEKTTNSKMSENDIEGYRRFVKNTLSGGSAKNLSKEQIVGGLFYFFGSEDGVNEMQLRLINEKSKILSVSDLEKLSDFEAGNKILERIFTNGKELSSRYDGNDHTIMINTLMQYAQKNLQMDISGLGENEKIALIGKLAKEDDVFYQNAVVARYYFGPNTNSDTGFNHLNKHIERGFTHNKNHSGDISLTDEEIATIKERYDINGNLIKEGTSTNIKEYPFIQGSTATGGARAIIGSTIDKNIENNTKESIIQTLSNRELYRNLKGDYISDPRTEQDLVNIAGFVKQFEKDTSFKNIGYDDLSIMAEKYAREVGMYVDTDGKRLRDDVNFAKNVFEEFKKTKGVLLSIQDDMSINPNISFKENLEIYRDKYAKDNIELNKLFDNAIDIIPNTQIKIEDRVFISVKDLREMLTDPENTLNNWGVGAVSDKKVRDEIEQGNLIAVKDALMEKQQVSDGNIYKMLKVGEFGSRIENNKFNNENIGKIYNLKQNQVDRELVEVDRIISRLSEDPEKSVSAISGFVKEGMLYPKDQINSHIIRDKDALNSDNIKNFVKDPLTFIKYNPQLASVYATAIIGDGRDFNTLFKNFTVTDLKDVPRSSAYSMKDMSDSEYRIFLENAKIDMVKNLGIDPDIANEVAKFATEHTSNERYKLTKSKEALSESQDDILNNAPKTRMGYDTLIQESLKEMGKKGVDIQSNPNLKNLLDNALKTGLIDSKFYLDYLNTNSVSNATKDYILNNSEFALTKKSTDVDYKNFKYITEAYHNKGGNLSVSMGGLNTEHKVVDQLSDIRNLETNGNPVRVLNYKDNDEPEKIRERINEIAKQVRSVERDMEINKALDKLENKDKVDTNTKENVVPTMENNPQASLFDYFANAFNSADMPNQGGGIIGPKTADNTKALGSNKKYQSAIGLTK